MAAASGGPSGKPRRHDVMRHWRRSGPVWPYLVLIGIPAACFVLPDLFGGHLLMTGDNAQQNYPLHVLVGSMLRHGQLPFWNQYIFSGSPLLADFNAGAFYPLVGLFVVLPDRVAWIATEVVLFSLIAVGMYTFLRALKLSTVACFLAAATFTFSGVVLSQANHVDMTEGYVAIPWMLLAVLHIIRDGRWRWSILLGVAFATVILGGAPEAMLDEAILVIAYAVVSAGIDRRRWWRVMSRGAAGAGLALSLAAIQWLPGLNAIASSQRSGLGHGFASTGSYPPAFTLLSLVPYLYGGYGHWGLQSYFSHYNLPEVEIYIGILPVVALLALLHPKWPSRMAGRERLTWYLVGLVGLLLAFGANTPLEHVFNAIPLYGHQRLQSRNMIDVSVAMCVLFAGWLDRSKDGGPALVTYDRLIGCLPFGVVLGLACWTSFSPASLIVDLAHASPFASRVHAVREASYTALALCAAALIVVWLRPRMSSKRWIKAAGVFVLVDLGLMASTSLLVSTPSNAVLAGDTPVEQYVAAHLAVGGRFVVYDPQGYSSSLRDVTGIPDVNVLAHLPSVAGYASIVNGDYSAITQTHSLGDLNIAQLRAGSLDGLDLQDVVTVPEYFLLPLLSDPPTISSVQASPEVHGIDPVLPLGNGPDFDDAAYPFYPAPRAAIPAGQSESWFLGESLKPTSVKLLFTAKSKKAVVRFGKIRAGGAIDWAPATLVRPGFTSVGELLPNGNAVGLAVQVLFGKIPRNEAFVSVDHRPFALDGSLSSALLPGVWRQQGTVQGYTLFVRVKPPIPIYAVSSSGERSSHVTVISGSSNAETARVRAVTPLTIVRDVAWDQGWEGSVSVNGGSSRNVEVTRHDLVQQLHVPPGNDVLTFRYQPPHLLVASILSVGALLFLMALPVVLLFRRRLQQKG